MSPSPLHRALRRRALPVHQGSARRRSLARLPALRLFRRRPQKSQALRRWRRRVRSGAVAAKAPTRQVSEQPRAVTCGISGDPPAIREALAPSVTKSTGPVTATTVPYCLARLRAASSASSTGSRLSTPWPRLSPPPSAMISDALPRMIVGLDINQPRDGFAAEAGRIMRDRIENPGFAASCRRLCRIVHALDPVSQRACRY